MRRVQDRQAQALDLRAIALRIDAEDDGQRGPGRAQPPDVLKEGNDRARERGQQAAPGQDRRDLVRDTGELRRQLLDGGADIWDWRRPSRPIRPGADKIGSSDRRSP